MNVGKFTAQRERIAWMPGRSNAWRKRALAMLVRRSGATERHADGGKLVSWQLPSGRIVCVKKRYSTEFKAAEAMGEMHREHDNRRKPIRAYACYHCLGWHLTSQTVTRREENTE
jgi:hypothetical protein